MKNQKHTCAVCGWRHLEAPQRSTSGGASHEICPSCGFESGYSDDDQGFTYEQWRERWVAEGLPWSSKGMAKPKLWNPMQDLHALKRRKRPVIPANRLRKAANLAQNEVENAALEKPIARQTSRIAKAKRSRMKQTG